jgi:thiamine biosynthesis lipoprotein
MKRYARWLAALLLVAVLVWLALRPQAPAPAGDPHLLQRDVFALGTVVSFTLYLPEPARRVEAEKAVEAAERFLAEYQKRWSVRGEGELGQFNALLAAGKAVAVPEALRPLFALAWKRREASGGRFDPRVGALVRVWGFDDESRYRTQPPPSEEIAQALGALRAAPPYVDNQPYGPAPGIAWDFGAIAKGDAIEQLSAQLAAAGFPDHIVNAGGNLRANGKRGDRGWSIGIRHPRPERADGEQILAALRTQGGEAVVTSGDYERYFEFQGQRYHHILDPASGQPARGLQSVTVVTTDAALADGATTALLVAGPTHWREVATALGVTQVLVVDDGEALSATPELARRLELPPGTVLRTQP